MSTYEIQNSIPMTTQEKRDKIKALTIQQLEGSYASMLRTIDKAIDSGAIDADIWDEQSEKFILPNAIVITVLQAEATAYDAKGTRFENKIKALSKILRRVI